MAKRIAIIGAGFSGLSSACYAAKMGYEVHVFEKHNQAGGRARQFTTSEGFVFDMGPSWYWMPDIIEAFFQDFDIDINKELELVRLDPQFDMVFDDGKIAMPSQYSEMKLLFENIESGAGDKLDSFMKSAKKKYELGMKEFVVKPCHSWLEFAAPKMLLYAFQLNLLKDFRTYVAQFFKHKKLRSLMEFPVIFLGSSPQKIPALYSMMNYGGYVLGTWYPMGGFYQLVLAMQKLATQLNVQFHFNKNVDQIVVQNNKVVGLEVNNELLHFDAIIGSSDYQHTESLLPQKLRNYTQEYWKDRVFAPSCLIYYLGLDMELPKIKHHTLFFEYDLDEHMKEIYETKSWPNQPLFYVCCPSKTDPNVAPTKHENLFLLLPIANDIEDTEKVREHYFEEMLKRLERHTGVANLNSHIVYKKSYCVSDFKNDYNAYGGNAYGLANTLQQTAAWKPKLKNKKLSNLLYTGQLTVPGPGVPPAIISGKIAAQEINKILN